MGFFSSAFGRVCSFVTGVVDQAKNIIEDGKTIAVSVLGKMADLGEKVVQTIKNVWEKTKPYLEKIQIAASFVKKIPGLNTLPKVLLIAEAIDIGITALFALEKSPVLNRLAAGVDWAIAAARHLSEKWLSEAEMAEAEERKRHFAEAADSLNEEQRRAVLFGQIINEFLMVRTRLQEQIDHGEITSFDQYLRLRATQKLVVDVNQRLHSTNELDDVSLDDLRVLQIAAQLLTENPYLSDEELQYLNEVVTARYGKELVPFIFEELVQGWALDFNHDLVRYEEVRDAVSRDETALETLEGKGSFGLLEAEEETVLEQLRRSVPAAQKSRDELWLNNNRRQHYIDAAEGLLQALENRLDPMVMGLIPTVGGVIISCMEKGVQWGYLTDTERALVIDFANKFRRDRVQRGEKLSVEAEVLVGVGL